MLEALYAWYTDGWLVLRYAPGFDPSGVLASQRRGTWTYYYARPGGLEGLTQWLS